MEQVCDKQLCTGCGACANACGKQAIVMQAGDTGFLYPVINPDLCVDCGLCRRICPIFNTMQNTEVGEVYAALAKENSLRLSSSSGGVFALLAEKVIKSGGMVYGAAYDENMTVRHIGVADMQGLQRLKGSKYVQSDVGEVYREIQEILTTGRRVLFSGTPCQVAGLKAFLRKDYDNLLLVDLLCHGVPSPKVFEKFCRFQETKCHSSIAGVTVKWKNPGWKTYNTKVQFADGTQILDNSYVDLFLKDICLRESCYHCQFADSHRVGDITLGDYWGYQETAPEYIQDDDLGISFVSVNTKKGNKYFKHISAKIGYARRTMTDALRGNPVLKKPVEKRAGHETIWQDMDALSWQEIVKKYGLSSAPKKGWMSEEDRAYFAKPYTMRHFVHKLRRYKETLLYKVRG